MAAKKKQNRKKKRQKKLDNTQAEARRELLHDDGGYDWGWPSLGLVAANDELVRRIRIGGFNGCGYGLVSQDGPPFIALVGENIDGMQSALALMREWVDLSGPNSIAVEILFDDPGYVISISQQPSLLRWRLSGIDSSDRSLVFTISVVKKLDSRHPFLADLAHYSRQPIAPVWLTVAATPPNASGSASGLDMAGFEPSFDKAILLPGINVYTKSEDRPKNSMILLDSEIPSKSERGLPPEPASDPVSMMQTRERRLFAAMPKTMHSLRHHGRMKALIASGASHGCAAWQVEQAVCNLRLIDHLAYQPSSKSKRLAMIDQLRNEIVEPASTPLDPAKLPEDSVLAQISLDAAFLLRRVEQDREPPPDLKGLNTRIQELGYA